jgi:hypothetical protein
MNGGILALTLLFETYHCYFGNKNSDLKFLNVKPVTQLVLQVEGENKTLTCALVSSQARIDLIVLLFRCRFRR